jgi:hypothetical protein
MSDFLRLLGLDELHKKPFALRRFTGTGFTFPQNRLNLTRIERFSGNEETHQDLIT